MTIKIIVVKVGSILQDEWLYDAILRSPFSTGHAQLWVTASQSQLRYICLPTPGAVSSTSKLAQFETSL